MSYISNIGGKLIVKAKEGIDIYAKGDIVYNSQKKISFTGKEGIVFGDAKPHPEKEPTLKKFIVHFRRPKDYQGEYGFDWLREEYIYPITLINNVNKALSLDTEKLKKEYKTIDVSEPISPYNIDYYPSFLNITLNQEVALDIEIEEYEPLLNDSTEILFESSNSNISVKPSNISLSNLMSDGKKSKNLGASTKNYYQRSNVVKIKCVNQISVNEQIKVFAKLDNEKKEVGKIMIMKNDEIYKLKARFVEIKFKGKLVSKDNNLGTENSLDFSTEFSNASLPRAGLFNSSKLLLSTTISNWKTHIESNENNFINKFSQALIKYEPYKNLKKTKIEYHSLKVDFKNFTIGTGVEGVGIDKIKKSISSIDIDAIACDMEDFLTGLTEMYAAENTPETGIIVFLLPIIIRYSNPPIGLKVDYLDGFSDDIFSTGKYIMMTNYSQSLKSDTLVHEAAHTLGLFHSFQTDTIDHNRPVVPDHTFEFQTTENIMDYSSNVLTFWKWQWRKMREDTIDLELIR